MSTYQIVMRLNEKKYTYMHNAHAGCALCTLGELEE